MTSLERLEVLASNCECCPHNQDFKHCFKCSVDLERQDILKDLNQIEKE